MSRYISTQDVQDHLELEDFNNTDDPKLRVVEKWISAAENEVDRLTGSRWDLHTVENELITPDHQAQDFLLSVRPLSKISKLEYQNGTEWSEDWVELDSSKYRIANAKISKIRTEDYYWKAEGLRVTYDAGYAAIPTWLSELTLLLVEKRYIMSRLGQAAADPESVSVAVIRIQDKSNASLNYRVEGLQKEIRDRLKSLGKSMKSRNFNVGYVNMTGLTKRSRY